MDIIFTIRDYCFIYDGDREKAKTGYLYRGLVLVCLILAVIFFTMESAAAKLLAIAFCGVGVYFEVRSWKYDMKCIHERQEPQGKTETEDG